LSFRYLKNNINFASFYEQLFGSQKQDLEFYKYYIEKNGGLALEIGSGTGRLLLPYLQLDLNVEGIEPDEAMSKICMKKSVNLKLKPIIYQQKLENLNIQKKYKTIYMPLFVFQNIIERDKVFSALKLAYEHLDQNGEILISIFIPWNDPTGTWEQTWRVTKVDKNNDEILVLSESVSFDKFEQIQTKYFKYEMFNKNFLSKSYITMINFRTYSRYELISLMEQIGYKDIEIFGDYEILEACSNTQTFIFCARR